MAQGDVLGFRKLIGIVVPSTNTVVQPDCDALRPRGVTNHIGRIPTLERGLGTAQTYEQHMQLMRDGIGDAMDLVMSAKVDHMIMGVALEAFQGGVAASNKLQRDLEDRAGIGVSMGAPATVAALKAFGARTISIVTPHQPKGDETVREFMEEAGFRISKLIGLKCESPLAIARVTAEQLADTLREIDGPDVDAIVQVGTNLSGIKVAANAEFWLKKPVLAINAITYWDALRRAGIQDKIYGFGRILEEF